VKFLPNNLDKQVAYNIEQGYLSTRPTIRIRKKSYVDENNKKKDDFILTYKSKTKEALLIDSSICASNEVELPLTSESYLHLKEKIDRNLVEKTRYNIPLDNGLIAELDVFKGNLEGLVFVEVEFESEKQALSFIPPDWFGIDVSSDYRYKNVYLSSITEKKDLEELI